MWTHKQVSEALKRKCILTLEDLASAQSLNSVKGMGYTKHHGLKTANLMRQ